MNIDLQLSRLSESYPDVSSTDLSDGSRLVSVRVRLPAGWTLESDVVGFVVVPAFPAAQPDCFYASESLRLLGGGLPINSAVQQHETGSKLWFSWHLSSWNPVRDDLTTYVRFIERRLSDVR